MSNFERRLSAIHKRPSVGPGTAAGDPGSTKTTTSSSSLAVDDGVGSLAWEAAERVSRILDVEVGTVVSLSVATPSGNAALEVTWNADGLPVIREL